jgi:hypothetical protein
VSEKENYVAEFTTADARKYGDIASIIQDLNAVQETCSQLIALLKENSKNHVLIENLWTAALIRYARCFASGKRFGLSEASFSGLEGEPVKVHRQFRNLRDKHIAHAVSMAEQIKVGLVLSPSDSVEKKVEGVALLSAKLICANIESVGQLAILAKVLAAKLSEVAKGYETKVLEVGRQVPVDELYSRPRIRITKGQKDYDTPRT